MRQYGLSGDKGAVYTVSRLTREIRSVLENGFSEVWVEGELSNYAMPASAHAYFSLKDKDSVINCVLFKNYVAGVGFCLEDGISVLCRGKISVYDKRGQYQLYVDAVEPVGKGALQMAFEQLKKKLSREGLFDGRNKKPLPLLPLRLGVVTSSTGAALRDIINVSRRRFPNIEIIVLPVRVQGPEAKTDISRAISEFNRYNDEIEKGALKDSPVDVIIVARGGGSLEDLWPFNEEIVARAIFGSRIPVVSAVGHEIDYTISDFVADLRAPTPSAAAEMIVPVKKDLMARIKDCLSRQELAVKSKIDFLDARLKECRGSYVLNNPLNFFRQTNQKLDELSRALVAGLGHLCELKQRDLALFSGKLNSLSPLAVLSRGYSVTFKGESVLKDTKGLSKGDMLTTKVAAGMVTSRVEGVIEK